MYSNNLLLALLLYIIMYYRKYWRFRVETKVYGVNFDALLLKFMCGWGLLNTCMYTYATTFDTTSCICGHHVYKDVWTPTLGDELECRREGDNDFDRYPVAVLRRGGIYPVSILHQQPKKEKLITR